MIVASDTYRFAYLRVLAKLECDHLGISLLPQPPGLDKGTRIADIIRFCNPASARICVNCRSAQCDGHVLALDSFTVPHEGPAGERLVSMAVYNASKSLSSSEAMRRAVLGSSGMLLLITDRDDPAVVDQCLSALYAACK